MEGAYIGPGPVRAERHEWRVDKLTHAFVIRPAAAWEAKVLRRPAGVSRVPSYAACSAKGDDAQDGATPVTGGSPTIVLGLRENRGQFWLLVLVNAFVGSMVGLERTVL